MKGTFSSTLLRVMKSCRTSIHLRIAAAKPFRIETHSRRIVRQWNHLLSLCLRSGFFPLLAYIVRNPQENRNEEAQKISGRNAHSAIGRKNPCTIKCGENVFKNFSKPRTKSSFVSSICMKGSECCAFSE